MAHNWGSKSRCRLRAAVACIGVLAATEVNAQALCDDIKRAIEMAPEGFEGLRIKPTGKDWFDARRIAGATSCYISMRYDPRYVCRMTSPKVTPKQVSTVYSRQVVNLQKCFPELKPARQFGGAASSMASTQWQVADRVFVGVVMSRGDGMSKAAELSAFAFNDVSIEVEHRVRSR